MALCRGCHDLQNRVSTATSFQDLKKPGVFVTIHSSYAELLVCADNCCDLCDFMRRELRLTRRSDASSELTIPEDFVQKIGVRFYWDEGTYNSSKPWLWFFEINFGERILDKEVFPRPFSECSRGRGAAPSPEQVLKMGYEWLRTCRTEHKHCEARNTDELKFLPTRLLDVGEPEQGSIRLLPSRGLQQPGQVSYVTLSYRWGTPETSARTTKDNFRDRLNGISVASLPRTIQDAVMVTRGLGLRYLWVDALCIIQTVDDENADWERELPNMGRIYRHSVLTITASGAKSSAFGLFSRAEVACIPVNNFYLPRNFELRNEIEGFSIKATIPTWNTTVEGSPLSDCGWVLQERMSASRSMFFTEEGVFWQCNELMSSEYGPINKTAREGYPALEEVATKVKSARVTSANDFRNENIDATTVWAALVQRFTLKALTVPTDRLPAVAGLAADISRLSGAQYSLGVFTHNLQQELAWLVSHPRNYVEGTAASLPGVPSWSWASLNRPIKFHPLSPWQFRIEMHEAVTKLAMHGQQIHVRTRLGKMLRPSGDIDTEIISPQRYMKGFGKAFSSLRHGHILKRSGHRTMASSLESTRKAIPIPPKFSVWYDTFQKDPFKDGEPLVCIQWTKWTKYRESNWTQNWTGALVVAPVSTEECTYRRIGWLEIEGEVDFWEEPSDIVLM